MDEEIEDIVGEVQYTDSQKSMIACYSSDFEYSDRSSPEKHNSTGKETYVIECDSEESEKAFPLQDCLSTVNTDMSLAENSSKTSVRMSVQCGPSKTITRCASTSCHKIGSQMYAQETFTQTSKTIIEIAETEGNIRRIMDSNNLETQTSLVSVIENKTVEYRIEVSSLNDHFIRNDIFDTQNSMQTDLQMFHATNTYIKDGLRTVDHSLHAPSALLYQNSINTGFPQASVDDESSKCLASDSENDMMTDTFRSDSESSSLTDHSKEVLNIISNKCSDCVIEAGTPHTSCTLPEDSNETDIEEDSLMEGKPELVNDDVKTLYDKIKENDDICKTERIQLNNFQGTLTPLTEETGKKDSIINMSDDSLYPNGDKENTDVGEDVFTSDTYIKVKVLKTDETAKKSFRLPPIQNNSCPNSPHLQSLFAKPKLNKPLPCLFENERHCLQDRWEMNNKSLASGESPLIRGKSESPNRPKSSLQLPPIHGEAPMPSMQNVVEAPSEVPKLPSPPPPVATETISINEKIKELKFNSRESWSKKNVSMSESRDSSPSINWPEESRASRDLMERGCDAVCIDLIRRLHSNLWVEVIETLEDLPKELDKFWNVMTETRVADLLRLVNSHVDSPRTQVTKTACSTIAVILKNTKYTRKPDFHEAMSLLLVKTGSYSRVVRRAANLALDHVVCNVDCIHAVPALCVHGVSHKNAHVRCAAARLLVVCCALAGGGRELLRARPQTVVIARRHLLTALAAILGDKSTDVRKYAERLYLMLRSLPNFEAFYVTDVEVELASKQIKKYDLLFNVTPKEAR